MDKFVDINLIYGVYELISIDSFINDQKTDETAKAGLFTFTRDKKVSVVNSSNDWIMSYVGSFEISKDQLLIQIKACVVKEMENTRISRKIVLLDQDQLIVDASGKDPSRRAEIKWKKIAQL